MPPHCKGAALGGTSLQLHLHRYAPAVGSYSTDACITYITKQLSTKSKGRMSCLNCAQTIEPKEVQRYADLQQAGD